MRNEKLSFLSALGYGAIVITLYFFLIDSARAMLVYAFFLTSILISALISVFLFIPKIRTIELKKLPIFFAGLGTLILIVIIMLMLRYLNAGFKIYDCAYATIVSILSFGSTYLLFYSKFYKEKSKMDERDAYAFGSGLAFGFFFAFIYFTMIGHGTSISKILIISFCSFLAFLVPFFAYIDSFLLTPIWLTEKHQYFLSGIFLIALIGFWIIFLPDIDNRSRLIILIAPLISLVCTCAFIYSVLR
ncbi:MAG: hypothetical protein AB1779_04500 [Candidatus Thermoplasmatota archaeon]